MFSVLNSLSTFESFKIIKFKKNLKKLIMISLFDISSTVESFEIIKVKRNFKKNNYDFCFGYFKYSSKFSKL